MFVGCVSVSDVRSFEHFLDQLIRRFTLRKPVLEGPESAQNWGPAILLNLAFTMHNRISLLDAIEFEVLIHSVRPLRATLALRVYSSLRCRHRSVTVENAHTREVWQVQLQTCVDIFDELVLQTP